MYSARNRVWSLWLQPDDEHAQAKCLGYPHSLFNAWREFDAIREAIKADAWESRYGTVYLVNPEGQVLGEIDVASGESNLASTAIAHRIRQAG